MTWLSVTLQEWKGWIRKKFRELCMRWVKGLNILRTRRGRRPTWNRKLIICLPVVQSLQLQIWPIIRRYWKGDDVIMEFLVYNIFVWLWYYFLNWNLEAIWCLHLIVSLLLALMLRCLIVSTEFLSISCWIYIFFICVICLLWYKFLITYLVLSTGCW